MSTRDDAIKAVQVAALTQWAPQMDGLTTWEAGVVVDAVDPIIRADERERIAQAIEKGCVHGRLVARDTQGVMVESMHQVCYRCQHAAAIARGTS